jgi:hypothetical protein
MKAGIIRGSRWRFPPWFLHKVFAYAFYFGVHTNSKLWLSLANGKKTTVLWDWTWGENRQRKSLRTDGGKSLEGNGARRKVG